MTLSQDSHSPIPEPNFGFQYQAGGTLPLERPYVPRKADEELYQAVKQGQFCYIFNCRQMGKSSLRTRVMDRLQREDGLCCAAIDLTGIGSDHPTPEQWYQGLISELNRRLDIFSGEAELQQWLGTYSHLPPVQRLSRFLEDALLVRIPDRPIAIFVDEIDAVLSLERDHGIKTSDFFALIRAFYNRRADEAAFGRLTFVLLGVATPSRLMRDKTRTPFNVGRGIDLGQLELGDAGSLLGGLRGVVAEPEQVLAEIFAWSGGQPFLTHWLCEQVQQVGFEAEGLLWIGVGEAQARVAALVREQVLERWPADEQLKRHFGSVGERVLRQEKQASRLLGLYGEVLERGRLPLVEGDETSQMELRLAGLVIREGGDLRVFNQIYGAVFDRNWVREMLARLRPYSEAFEAWVASDFQDESRLLQGQALLEALEWSQERQLMPLDDRFLRESQGFERQELQRSIMAERQAKEIVELAKYKTEQRLRRGSFVFAVMFIGASIAGAISLRQLKAAHWISKAVAVKVDASHAEADELEGRQLPGLVQGISAGRALQALGNPPKGIHDEVKADLREAKLQTQKVLSSSVYGIQEHNVLKSNQGRVRDVRFSADGQKLVSGGVDGIVKVWNLNGSEPTVIKAHDGGVNSAIFSPDGKSIVSGGGDGHVRVWTLDGRERTRMSAHPQNVHSVDFSSDGRTIVSGGADGTVKLWNLDGSRRLTIQAHETDVSAVSFSPNGQMLISGGMDGRIKLWNLDGTERFSIDAHRGKQVQSLSFSPDGQTIASGGTDSIIKLWDTKGDELSSIKTRQNQVDGVQFGPDGQMIISAGADGTVKLWNVSDGSEHHVIKAHQGRVWRASFSSDDNTIASGGENGTVKLWKIDGTPNTVRTHKNSVNTAVSSAQFSSDGQMIVSGGGDGMVVLWNISDSKSITIGNHEDNVNSVNFSPDDQLIISGGADGQVKLWNVDGGGRAALAAHTGSVESVNFSPNGKAIVSGGADGVLKVWNVHESEPMLQTRINEAHPGGVDVAIFSPDGQAILSSGVDKVIRLWNLKGEQLNVIEAHQGQIRSISFSPDGKMIASGGADGSVKLWNLEGDELNAIQAHQGIVWSVNFSPDGKTIVTCGWDSTVKIWNVEDGSEYATINTHQSRVKSVDFSPDGHTLVSAGENGTIKIVTWEVEPLLDLACPWIKSYLNHNPDVSNDERALCGIAPRKEG